MTNWKTILTAVLYCLPILLPHCGPDRPSPAPDKKNLAVPCADTITVAFYNVENLFDLHYDGNEYPEYRPGALGWNKETQGIKLANIASVIAALQADVIGLCEVENDVALADLQKELKRQGAPYPWRAAATKPSRASTAPCLLSRLPLTGIAHHGAGDGKRPVLEADVDWCGRPLKLFVN
ncbi:MAG: hypothetical protein JXA71_10715, partial [Chitinispirillaceae bacterium]|nr:hypothetical protein [Chitinispirillaceae bacterium]